MLIFEVFDKTVPYDLSKTPQGYYATFTISDITFSVEVYETMPESEEAFLYMEKKLGRRVDPMGDPDEFDKASAMFPSYEVSFRHKGAQNYDITNTGNQYKVFATVLNIIAKVVRARNPIEIHFDSKEPSRTKLYDRMVRVLSDKMGFKPLATTASKSGSKDYVLVNANLK